MKPQKLRVAFKDIDSYISSQGPEIRLTLGKLRETIKRAVPDAEEGISYQMPVLKYYGVLAYFAAFKNHYSMFVRPKYLQAFKHELTSYTTTKSAIHFSFDEPVPVRLVAKIVKHVAKANRESVERKRSKR
jgi:uncharacterized protein YdhG (YjbR/CyaY superfamily)